MPPYAPKIETFISESIDINLSNDLVNVNMEGQFLEKEDANKLLKKEAFTFEDVNMHCATR